MTHTLKWCASSLLSLLHHAEFGLDDHREDVPLFMSEI